MKEIMKEDKLKQEISNMLRLIERKHNQVHYKISI